MVPRSAMTKFVVAILCLSAATQGQDTTAPTTKPAERFMTDEEFLRIGQEFDLDAYLKKLGAIPPRKPSPADAKPKLSARDIPALSKEVEDRIADFSGRIDELKFKSAAGDDEEVQKKALDEAISLAEQIVKMRTDAGQPEAWYEVVDAMLLASRLRQVRKLSTTDRARLAATWMRNADIGRLYSERRFEAAVLVVRSQLAILERHLPGHHRAEASALQNLAVLHITLGRHSNAVPLIQEALKMRQQLFNDDHPEVATSLNLLGIVREYFGHSAEAERLFLQALELRRRLYPSNHPDMAQSLYNVASVRIGLGRSSEAEPILEDLLEMYQRSDLGDDRNVALCLNSLASVRQALGRLSEAEPMFKQALELNEHLFEGDSQEVAASLNNLAAVYMDLDRPSDAEPLYEQALRMLINIYQGDHRDIAKGLNNLGYVCSALGRLSQAEVLYHQALDMRQRLFQGDHEDVATSLNNLAFVRSKLGRNEEAEPLYQRALEMQQRVFKCDHSDIARSLSNLALTRQALDRAGKAEPLLRQALEMSRRLNLGDHPDVAINLNNLALVLKSNGHLSEAEELYQQALDMYRRLFKGDHRLVASSLMNLALVRQSLGLVSQAELLCQQAHQMYQRLYQDDRVEVATSLNNLALIQLELDRTTEAEALIREAFEMSERLRRQTTGGEVHRAAMAQELQLTDRAVAYSHVLIRLQRDREVMAVLERGRARAALDLLERSGRDFVAEAKSSGDAERKRRLEDAQAREQQARTDLASAEFLLAAQIKQAEILEQRTDLEADVKADRLADLERQIEATKEDVKEKRNTLTQAGAAVLIELRGLFPAGKALTLEEIVSGMEADEAVVSFACGKNTVLTAVAVGSASCAAIVADGEDATKDLVEKLAQLRRAIADRPEGGESLDRETLASLRSTLLPDSLMELLAGARRWVVLPDGPLNGIPLELLWPNVDSAPQIVYAPSATVYLNRREAARKRVKPAKEDKIAAVIVGDPDFGDHPAREPQYPDEGALLAMVSPDSNAAQAGLQRGDILTRYGDQTLVSRADLAPAIQRAAAAATQPAETGKEDQPPEARSVPVTYWRDGQTRKTRVQPGKLGVAIARAPAGEGLRSMKLIDQVTRGDNAFSAGASALEQVRLFGGRLDPLPGTGREARAIADVLRRKGGRPTLLVGADANAPKLWEAVASKRPRYVHLATHGLMGSTDRPLDAALALAQPTEPTADDIGFLRLDDLMSRWGGRLDNCDLVVLSACDTQRGIKKGGSVMSLPLGFFFAGAPTVVASLWKVDDTATQLLMTRFYENLLGQYDQSRQIARRDFAAGTPMPKAAALREAKRWLRTLPAEQVEQRLAGGISDDTRGTIRERVSSSASQASDPYAHPYFWAGFVLIGDPE